MHSISFGTHTLGAEIVRGWAMKCPESVYCTFEFANSRVTDLVTTVVNSGQVLTTEEIDLGLGSPIDESGGCEGELGCGEEGKGGGDGGEHDGETRVLR